MYVNLLRGRVLGLSWKLTTEFSLAAANFHNRSQAGTLRNFLARDGWDVHCQWSLLELLHTVQSVILRFPYLSDQDFAKSFLIWFSPSRRPRKVFNRSKIQCWLTTKTCPPSFLWRFFTIWKAGKSEKLFTWNWNVFQYFIPKCMSQIFVFVTLSQEEPNLLPWWGVGRGYSQKNWVSVRLASYIWSKSAIFSTLFMPWPKVRNPIYDLFQSSVIIFLYFRSTLNKLST